MTAPPRVLVTEDDDAVRGVILRVLGQRGYDVIEACHMQEALERVKSAGEAPIDLLITDFFMPGGTGRELADALWAVDPDLPVLFMSGYDENVPEGEDPTRVVHLAKPFKTSSLLEHVARLLRQAARPLPPGAA